MEIYGLNIWVYVIGIPVAALFGWILWKKAMQGDDWSDPKKSWSADYDPKKVKRYAIILPVERTGKEH